jgi:hypothetical protein
MLHKLGVTQSLAHFIAATRWDDIPLPVAHQAKALIYGLLRSRPG